MVLMLVSLPTQAAVMLLPGALPRTGHQPPLNHTTPQQIRNKSAAIMWL